MAARAGVIKVGEGRLRSAAVSKTSRSNVSRVFHSNLRSLYKVRCCGWLSAQRRSFTHF